MNEKLPPGEYDVSYEDLKKLGGVHTIPKRLHIRKLRRDDGYWTSSEWLMYMLYPWILSDERGGTDISAFRTWEAAYAKAYEMVTAIPKPIDFARLRQRFTTDAMYRLFGAHGLVMPNESKPTVRCDCGHVMIVHDYTSDGLYRAGCAVCDCKKTRSYTQ